MGGSETQPAFPSILLGLFFIRKYFEGQGFFYELEIIPLCIDELDFFFYSLSDISNNS